MADAFAGGKLRLKGVKEGKVKKKKKKQKLDEEALKAELQNKDTEEIIKDAPVKLGRKKTQAETAFMKIQEKREGERILKKAQTSHKERVEQFNEHLDELIEHFDIPKVSWTK